MKYFNFGQSGDSVSTVILGLMRTADIGKDSLKGLCETALEAGINFFDTADCYAAQKVF